jgi:ribonuclease P protein component
MFAKSHRFSFKKGAPRSYYQAPLFVLRYDKNQIGSLRCAVVVGKKVDKRAVVRNKIKRQVLELIRELLSVDTKATIAVYAKKPILEAEIDERRSELKKALGTTGILQWT